MNDFKRKTTDEIGLEMQKIQRSISRAPQVILFRIQFAKERGYLDSESAMVIFNTYTMSPKDIYILMYSHGIIIDLEGLLNMIDHQKEEESKMISCDHVAGADKPIIEAKEQ